MSAFLPFEHKLAAHWPADRWRDVRVVVAVSGGPDSVSLLRGMDRLRDHRAGSLAVAHFNHGLRGELALKDQQFVERLCGSLGVECAVGQPVTPPTRGSGEAVEAALRLARYEFLARAAERLGARYVATGHTANDQAETIVHHILRGTGLRGLSGMRRVRPLSEAVTLVRPLLSITRDEVLDYLAGLAQPYQQDETNRDCSLVRNRIRHELLPLLARDYSPSIVESLLRLGGLAGDAQRVIDTLGESLLEACLVECGAGRVVIDCGALQTCDRHLVREVFLAAWRRQCWPQQSMGFAQWDLLAEMALAEPERGLPERVFPGAIAAQRQGERLILRR